VNAATRRKTSFEIDTAKVDAARAILGTKTLTETVDVALEEIVKRRGRERLVELLSDPSTSDLADPEIMAGAWR
jgi:Arc/MetJ family transcription regulator